MKMGRVPNAPSVQMESTRTVGVRQQQTSCAKAVFQDVIRVKKVLSPNVTSVHLVTPA